MALVTSHEGITLVEVPSSHSFDETTSTLVQVSTTGSASRQTTLVEVSPQELIETAEETGEQLEVTEQEQQIVIQTVQEK